MSDKYTALPCRARRTEEDRQRRGTDTRKGDTITAAYGLRRFILCGLLTELEPALRGPHLSIVQCLRLLWRTGCVPLCLYP